MENTPKTEVVIVLPDKTRYTLVTDQSIEFTDETVADIRKRFGNMENIQIKVRPNGTQLAKWIVLWGDVLKNSYLEITSSPN